MDARAGNKMADLLTKLTLVITTHNRNSYLARTLDYLSEYKYPIIIADSSSAPYNREIAKGIQYLYTPEKKYTEKLFNALNRVKTPYVLLYPDDDFLIVNAVESFVTFMDEHPDYSSVQGNCVGFSIKPDKIGVAPAYTNSFKRAFGEDSASKRVEQLLSDYMQIYYAVYRTEVLRKSFEFTSEHVTNLIINEVFLSVFSLVEGKHAVLPVFYFAREAMSDAIGNELFDTISTEERHKPEYSWFMDTTSELISRKDHISKEVALGIMNAGVRKMVSDIDQLVAEVKGKKGEWKTISLLKKVYRYRLLRAYWTAKKGYPAFFRHDERRELKRIIAMVNKYRTSIYTER